MRPTGLTRSSSALLLGTAFAVSSLTVRAQEAEVDTAAQPPVDGVVVTVSQATVASTPTQAGFGTTGPTASFATATQTMLWANRGRLALGLGVEQAWQAPARLRMPDAAGPYADRRMVLGLGVNTSAATRLSWQTSVSSTGSPDDAGPTLVLKRTDPMRSLARGAFRMELSKDTSISIRPRGRRVGVALSSQW